VIDKREWGEEGGHRKPDQDEGVVGANSRGGGGQKCKPKVQAPDFPCFPEFPPSATDFGAHSSAVADEREASGSGEVVVCMVGSGAGRSGSLSIALPGDAEHRRLDL